MPICALPASGFDPTVPLAVAVLVLLTGVIAVVVTRRRGKALRAALAVPLLLIALLAAGQAGAPGAYAASDCPPATGGGSQPIDFQPGAAGIGDPYYPLDGNGGYDVADYALDLAYDPATDVLSGTAAITLTATQNLSAFNLDFDTRAADGSDAITVADVRVDGASTPFSLATTQISMMTAQPVVAGSGDAAAQPPRTELTVSAGTGIIAGRTVVVEVDYSGVPITIDDAFGPAGVFHTDDGMVVVGQPRVAATWFPSNDHPSDKATMTLTMTAPTGLVVIGNGEPTAPVVEGGATTWTYVMDRPMATYLATATVGDYDVEVNTVDGVTYLDAVAQSLFSQGTAGTDARAAFGLNPTVVAYLSSLFGPYPFAESGGISVDVADLGFALENQTRPIYPGPADEATIVHELAHQWYGDDVAIARWSDIWLNEGFATYAEWLWSESQGGDTAQQAFEDLYALPDSDPLWSVVVADPGAAGIFDDATYARGAMTLHALRLEVGDPVFFDILQGWASENSGGNVSTAQFESYASSVSGTDLTAFFTSWLHTAAKP